MFWRLRPFLQSAHGRVLATGAAIALIDSVYLPLHLSGVTFKTVGYGLPRVRPQRHSIHSY